MKKLTKIASLFAVGFVMASASADQKGTDIMQQVTDFKKPKFSQSQVVMVLKDKAGAEEKRQVIEYGKEAGGKTYAVMDFKGPASIKDTRFLQITGDNAPDEKFIYLPSLKSVRRVNSSEGSKAFIGTDATYDDLTTRKMDEDEHEFVKEEKKTVESGVEYDCYVVKNTPIDKKNSQYSYRMVWVDKATMYPVHTEMFDKNGKLIKVLEVLKIEDHGGYNIPMADKLTNVQTGHSTSLNILKVIVDQPIPDRVFTQSFLSTGK